jgi:hypothetical protein
VAKAELLAHIQEVDGVADEGGLDEDGWGLRYHLEGSVEGNSGFSKGMQIQSSSMNFLMAGNASV